MGETRSSAVLEQVRREPFRLFFPLAFLLGGAGVGHWLLFAAGSLDRYLGLFHAVTMTQAFLLAFAAGFLMTAVPKRTGSSPARWAEVFGVATSLVVVSVAALCGNYAAAELAYAAAVVVLASFALRRFVARSSKRRPPGSFVLVPLGLAAGLAGAALLGVGSGEHGSAVAFDLGRRLAFESVFTLLTLGVGSFFLPLALRGAAAPDAANLRGIAGYAAAGLAIIGAHAVVALGAPRAGHLAVGLVTAGVLARSGALRWPTLPGANRRLVWLAAAALPAGPLLAAALPAHAIAAMHVTFIGGFGLLAFSVATHVTLGHGGFDAQKARRPWPILLFGAAFAIAAAARASATAVPGLYLVALGVAAAAWCAGALVWFAFLLPKFGVVAPEAAAATAAGEA